MREITIPELVLPVWHSWENRGEIGDVEYPGVYLLALSVQPLTGKSPSWEEVSYIGMTNSRRGLAGRWYQFDRAVRGKGGHSGGNRIFELRGHRDSWAEDLFVTGMAIECDVARSSAEDLKRMGWVAFLEYEAFAQCTDATGVTPEFNIH